VKRKLFYTTLLVVLLTLTIMVGPVLAGETWLNTPVVGSIRCGAGFGERNPLGGQDFHNAVDMACGMYRARVLAVASGEVVWNTYWPIGSAPNVGHGITVIIKHHDGLYTYSAHLDEAAVKVGQQIDQGSVVGYVGNTGYVLTTPSNPNYHLHFAVRNTGPDDGGCWDATCWLDPDNYLGTNPEIPNPDPDPDPQPNPGFNLITTIDKIVAILKLVPGFEDWGEKWEKIRGYISYLPWVLAILTLLILIGLLWLIKPALKWITESAWWQKRYHNVELFCLALFIYIFGKEDLYWAQMAQFAFAAWAFYFLEQIIEKLYRHFNYDPSIEKDGPSKREWLRKIINMMFHLILIMSILAYSWGYFLLSLDFQELINTILGWFRDPDQPDPPDLPDPPDPLDPDPPDPPNPDPHPTINFNCDFNPIKAGLGPVQVSCDAHGLPQFLITWWNGQKFNFQIPLEIWMAALQAGDTPEQVLGIIAIGSSESTGFTNYQVENPYGALGVWQFLPATYTAWAEPGYENPSYRTNIPIAAKAVGNMMEGGMNEIYLMDRSNFVSCFMGGNGCWTWNIHAQQADYAYRILFALKVAAGLK